MSIPTTIRAMREAGVSPEKMLEVVYELATQEENIQDEKLAKARASQAKYMKNKQLADLSSYQQISAVSAQKERKEPKERKTTNPLKENKLSSLQKKNPLQPRGQRIPSEFKPNPSDIAACQAKRPEVTDAMISEEVDKFRDYWIAQPGQKGVKLDWDATFRNWLRNANYRQQKMVDIRQNGSGVYIRKGCKQWIAWLAHGRKFNDFSMVASMDAIPAGGERKFKAEWPSGAY